jgi:hypothetical protein
VVTVFLVEGTVKVQEQSTYIFTEIGSIRWTSKIFFCCKHKLVDINKLLLLCIWPSLNRWCFFILLRNVFVLNLNVHHFVHISLPVDIFWKIVHYNFIILILLLNGSCCPWCSFFSFKLPLYTFGMECLEYSTWNQQSCYFIMHKIKMYGSCEYKMEFLLLSCLFQLS